MINLIQYRTIFEKVKNRPSYIRLGQAWFNELFDINTDIANLVRGTEIDPFHNDTKLAAFLKAVCDKDCYYVLLLEKYGFKINEKVKVNSKVYFICLPSNEFFTSENKNKIFCLTEDVSDYGFFNPSEIEKCKKYYTPLPDCVTINNSSIHGLGLFATKDIKKGTNLGVTHVKNNKFEDGYIRTPLGGFFNHSTEPNAKVVADDEFITLITLTDIKANDEILAFYTLYDPTK